VNGTALQSTLREMRAQFTDPRVLGGLAVVALLLGLSGPFGTFELLGPLQRFAYWAAIVLFTYAAGFLTASLVENLGARRLPRWGRVLATGLPSGVAAGLVVVTLNAIAFGPGVFDAAEIATLFINSILIALAVIAISMLIAGAVRARTPTAAPNSPPTILERVPLPQRGQLLALSVEDHYVSIVTDRGHSLVLMRLADAMRETGSVPGLQIHRSHWVARAAVVRVHRTAGKLTLELSNGSRLPVSRGYIAEARAAGFT
jgi:hypothetical protein